MSGRTLTNQEKVLLHLFDFSRHVEDYVAPPEVTQEGIANAAAIRRPHVTQYVRPLLEREEAEEGTKHVEGKARRLKVYFLTTKGRQRAAAFREALLKDPVPFRRQGGEIEELPLAQVYQEHRRGSPLLELLEEHRTLGYVSQTVRRVEGGLVDFTDEAPLAEAFFGREAELDRLVTGLRSGPTVVLTGMAGIGKSTLASRVRDAFQDDSSVFWRRVRTYDSATDLALRVASFLKALGRVGLYGYLSAPGSKQLSKIEELLAADLAGIRALFVLDDVHKALEDAQDFLRVFHSVARPNEEAALLLVSRYIPDFYSRREVAVEQSVLEVPLTGLDEESSQRLLAAAGVAEPLLRPLAKAAGGNTLFLELLISAGGSRAPDASPMTIETYIAEEIAPALSSEERTCLELASLYEAPVVAEALLLVEQLRKAALLSVVRKGLLGQFDGASFLIHDSLRAYFRAGMSRASQNTLVEKAVTWLQDRAKQAALAGTPQDAIGLIGNAVSVEVDPQRVVSSLELLARYRRQVGDYPGATEAYRVALDQVPDPEVKARLHRKMALSFSAQGQLEEAEEQIGKARALLADTSSLERAWLFRESAVVAFMRQDFDAAYEAAERGLELYSKLGNDSDLFGWLSNLRGLIHIEDSQRLDPPVAYEDLHGAVQAFEATENLGGQCIAYNNLGLAALHLDRLDEALDHINHSLEIADAGALLPGREGALFSKAFLYMDNLGDYDAAEQLLQETYQLAQESHLRQKVIWHAKYFAELFRRQGRFEEARESLGYFLEASGEMINDEMRIATLSLMARLCLECGDAESARDYVRQGRDLVKQSPSEYARYAVEWAEAAIHAREGDPEGAIEHYERALERTQPGETGEFLLEYGRYLASREEYSQANEILLRAEAELRKTSKPLAEVAKREMEALGS